MEKIDALRQMERAWREAGDHSENIERIMLRMKENGRPTPELQKELSIATKLYDEAMHIYKEASRSYYELFVDQLA